ncbi:hypothetical protein StoSoilB3_17990 [Arthrobacter sp. StoSoilB3]|nr:hypothetical protein StoSoilB3_17990 [Arthrobacter sp. StoSoilB3]
MTNPAIHQAGDRSLLIDVGDRSASTFADDLRHGQWASRLEAVVPTSSSVLVSARFARDLLDLEADVSALLEEDLLANQQDVEGRTVTLHVVYDGPDLAFVAQQCGLTVEGVVQEHTGTQHQVGFFGFAPGFAYIDGLSPRLHLPRRESPRTEIPAGSVAIAANQSVVYPGSTPGGWHLIGRTTTKLWDLREEPPAKLSAGDKIIFKSVEGTP